MKTKKILLSVLICLVMVVSVCLTVACQPKEVKLDLSDATQWGPAVAEGEEDIYRVSKDTDGNLVFDFAKNDTYNATRIAFAAFSVDELSKVKTLVVTAKMTTDAPYPALLFKVEGTDDPADAEVKVKATEDYTTYEWDFAGYDLTKVTRFLIFADPGVAGSSGKITVKEIYLTDKEVNADNDATKKPAEEGKAPAPVWNEVTASNMSVGNWVDGTANNVYTVTKTESSYKVDVHKKVGAGQWDALISYIHGDALATAKTFKLVVKGTAGKQILVKPFDSFERRVTLTGENQEIVIDVHTFAEDTTKDFSQKDAPTAENKVCIMGLPDVTTGNDTFTIISAEFSTEAAAPVEDPNVNEITADNHKITKGWEGLDAGTYTVTADGTAFNVAYTTNDYQWLRTYVKGEEIANMKTIVFTVSGTEGNTILFKPFNLGAPVETRHTFTGNEDVVTIDVSSYVSGKTFTEKEPILICSAPGVSNATGTFRIINVEFSAQADTSIKASEYNGDLQLGFNNYWRDNGDEKWTISDSEGIWTLAYAAEHSWASATTRIALGDAVMNYISVEVKCPVGQKYIIKFAEGNQIEVNGTGEFAKYSQKLSANVTGTVDVLVFAAWDDANAGEIQIKSAVLYNVAATAGEGDLDVNGKLAPAPKDCQRYNFSTSEGKYTISYSNNGSWDSLLMWVDLGEGGYDKLTFDFTALQGHTAIISFNGTENKWENDNKFTGEEEPLNIDVSEWKGLVFIRIFLDFDTNADNANGGTFVINNAVFTKTAA